MTFKNIDIEKPDTKHTLKKKGRAFRNIGKEKYSSLTVKSALLFI